jgi:serine/threonine protein kinase
MSLKTLNESLLEVKDSVASIEILANDGDPCLSNGDWPVPEADRGRVEKLEAILETLLSRIFSHPAVISTVWDDDLLDRLTEVFDDKRLQSILESTSSGKPEVDEEHGDSARGDEEEGDSPEATPGPEDNGSNTESGNREQEKSRRPPAKSNQKEDNGDDQEVSEDEDAEQEEEEWSDDNDVGFVWMSVTEDEFYTLQEEAMAEQQQKAMQRAAEAAEEEDSSGKGGGEDFGDGYEEDMAAMAVMQAEQSAEGAEEVKPPLELPVLDEPASPDPKDLGRGSAENGTADADVTNDAGDDGNNDDGAETAAADPRPRGLIESDPAALAAIYATESAKYVQLNLPVYHEPRKTGFEESKEFKAPRGTIIAGRYQVLQFLGEAAFSTALKCLELRTGRQVCVKVIKNSKDFFDQSLDEIQLLKYINSRIPEEYRFANSRTSTDEAGAGTTGGGDGGGADGTSSVLVTSNKTAEENSTGAGGAHVLALYDYFYFKEHLFIVGELLRDNLYEFSRYNRESGDDLYFTLPRLQRVCTQILQALRFVHSIGIIHCDLKPENILIKSYSKCEVKLIDFGSSCFKTDHLTSYIQSRSYRAPEVMLGLPYSDKIDIWSFGCIVAELFTGRVLFQNDSVPSLLARVIGILGIFPENMLLHGRDVPRYFTANHVLYEKAEDRQGFILLQPKNSSLRNRLRPHYLKSKKAQRGGDGDGLGESNEESTPEAAEAAGAGGKDDSDADFELFVDFVEHMLQKDPARRPSADEALQHPWLQQVRD